MKKIATTLLILMVSTMLIGDTNVGPKMMLEDNPNDPCSNWSGSCFEY